MSKLFGGLWLLVCLFEITASSASAAAIFVPPSLNPGDSYRIIFVTSTKRDAFATTAVYNTFVTAAANLDPGLQSLTTTWTALVSTSSTNALVNTSLVGDTTTLIFNTNGGLVATGGITVGTGLYGGPGTLHTSPILTEAGAAGSFAWTSTDSSGVTFLPLIDGFTLAGSPGSVVSSWTAAGLIAGIVTLPGGGPVAVPGAIYGISGLLTVPAVPTPEPGTLVMSFLGAAFLVLVRNRRARLR